MEEQIIDTQEQVIENVSNEVIANSISDKLGFEFSKYILVKPMPLDKVYKTLTVPEKSGEKDEEGEDIMQMTIKEVEVESKLRRGVVIIMPTNMLVNDNTIAGMKINVGDTIIYHNTRSIDFDLFKDSALVEPYDVVAKSL
jgi:co-chaperonin GroES (HSP10)